MTQKMVQILGPSNPLGYRIPPNPAFRTHETVPIIAMVNTFGEALIAYERAFGVSIVKYDGRFEHTPVDPNEPEKYFVVVDALGNEHFCDPHIARPIDILGLNSPPYSKNDSWNVEYDEICPKWDLDFQLEDYDEVLLQRLHIC